MNATPFCRTCCGAGGGALTNVCEIAQALLGHSSDVVAQFCQKCQHEFNTTEFDDRDPRDQLPSIHKAIFLNREKLLTKTATFSALMQQGLHNIIQLLVDRQVLVGSLAIPVGSLVSFLTSHNPEIMSTISSPDDIPALLAQFATGTELPFSHVKHKTSAVHAGFAKCQHRSINDLGFWTDNLPNRGFAVMTSVNCWGHVIARTFMPEDQRSAEAAITGLVEDKIKYELQSGGKHQPAADTSIKMIGVNPTIFGCADCKNPTCDPGLFFSTATAHGFAVVSSINCWHHVIGHTFTPVDRLSAEVAITALNEDKVRHQLLKQQIDYTDGRKSSLHQMPDATSCTSNGSCGFRFFGYPKHKLGLVTTVNCWGHVIAHTYVPFDLKSVDEAISMLIEDRIRHELLKREADQTYM